MSSDFDTSQRKFQLSLISSDYLSPPYLILEDIYNTTGKTEWDFEI